jgi:DNA-binding MarR family transcriptional regulator
LGPDLEKAILELSLRMRLIRFMQEEKELVKALSEREILLLQLIAERGTMTVSEIAAAYPTVSESTISTSLTKLWRDRGMISKTISPENQRTTLVELTDKGKNALAEVMKSRGRSYNALFHAIQVTKDERDVLVRICHRAVQYMDEHLNLRPGKGSVATSK